MIRQYREYSWPELNLDEFRQFGYVYSSFRQVGEITFTISLFDPECDTYEKCRKSSYENTENAIALAEEKYDLREYELKISYDDGYPIEITLMLTVAEKET